MSMDRSLAVGEWSFRQQFWLETWYTGVRPDPLGDQLIVLVKNGMMDGFRRSVPCLEWENCRLHPREQHVISPGLTVQGPR